MFGVAATANSGLLEDTNYHEGDMSRRCNTSLVVAWLRDNYRFGKSGSISKNSVYQHYLDECRGRGLETDINQTYFGKLVKKAFAGIQYNRKGPRGRSEHHYKRLKRVKHHAAGNVVLPPSHAFAAPPTPVAATTTTTTTPPLSYHHRHPHELPPPPRHYHHGHCPGTPAFHSPRHQHPTAVAAAAEAVGGSLPHTPRRDTEVIGRTSSRSPSPPSSPHQWASSSAHHQHQHQHQHHAPLGASFPLPPATAPGQYALAHQHQHQHQQAPPHALFPNHHHQQQQQSYVVAEAAVPAWCHRCCANSNNSSSSSRGEAMDPFGVVAPSSSPVPHRACSPTMSTWQGSLFQHQHQQHRESADEEVEVEVSLFQPRQGWTLRQSTINHKLPYCWW